MCVGVLVRYRHKFNPIPLPLIAYASTLVWDYSVVITTRLTDVLCSRHTVYSKDTPLVTGTEVALQLGTLALFIGIVLKPWSF